MRGCGVLPGYTTAPFSPVSTRFHPFSPVFRTPSRVVGFRHRTVIQIGLTPVVEVTKSLARALEARDYERAIKMRGKTFKTVLDIFLETREFLDVPQTGNKVCVVHSGSPAAGMNVRQ